MSAIAGVVAFEPQEIPVKDIVQTILHKLELRGRQDEGYVVFQGGKALPFLGRNSHPKVLERNVIPDIKQAPSEAWLAFGHRLGSIYTDVHADEHQPISDAAGKIWLVMDGEIFNALQLAKELHSRGAQFRADSQAEIILKAYQVWGESILSRLEGSFSFVIYDQNEDKIFAARDPFGIKPFYYCHEEGVFAFASELKGLFGLPFVSKKMSKSAVFDYLLLGESETHIQSIFRGLSELMPGSAMTMFMPKGNIKIWSYFNIATDSKIERYSRNKVSTLSHRLRKALVQNVSDHLSPGYPTAYCLNSERVSLVFPFLLKESIREMRPQERPEAGEIYSCLAAEDALTDSARSLIQNACNDLGTQLISSTCTFRDFSENLLKVCYLQDVPFTNLSVFQHYKMVEAAAQQGIKLLVEPVGGQQLFATSAHHFSQYLEDQIAKGNYSQFLDNLSGYSGSISVKSRLLFQLGKKILFKTTSDDLKESILRNNQEDFSYLKDNFKDRYFKNLENKIKSLPGSLNQLIASEIHGSLVKEMLRTSDRNAQAFGMEIRHPYLSSRALAEPVLKASSVYKIREGQPGNLLNKAMRGVFPDFVNSAKIKAYQNEKERKWMRDASEELKEFVTPDLDDFIDSRRIRNDWDKLFLSENPQRMEFIWRIINLGVWRHVYFS